MPWALPGSLTSASALPAPDQRQSRRFNRTLLEELEEWAYARPYRSEAERRAAFDTWLHIYNHHRGRTALGGLPLASRVTNLSGQNT
jgi:transposase InsO family protein